MSLNLTWTIYNRSTEPAAEPANNSYNNTDTEPKTQPAAEPKQRPRRNPRLVIGNLDFFELLMEQDEQ